MGVLVPEPKWLLPDTCPYIRIYQYAFGTGLRLGPHWGNSSCSSGLIAGVHFLAERGKGMIRKEGRKEGGGYMEGEQRRIVPKNGRLRLSTEMRLF